MPLTANDFNLSPNATSSDIAALNQALAYLANSTTAEAKMEQAVADGVTINFIHDGNDQYRDGVNTIDWDPNSALAVVDTTQPNLGTIGVQSAALGLAHEAAHANDPNIATDKSMADSQYDTVAERVAVGVEDQIATELGETLRFNHSGNLVEEANSTEHTKENDDGTASWVQSGQDGDSVNEGSFTSGTRPAFAPDGSNNSDLTVDGSGIQVVVAPLNSDVHVLGHDDTINVSSSNVDLSPGSTNVTIVGDSNAVSVAGSVTVNGNNNSVEALASGSIIDVTGVGDSVSSSGNTVNINGTPQRASIDGNDNTVNVTDNGGSTINVSGANDIVRSNGNDINVGSGSSATVVGNDNVCVADDGGVNLTLSGIQNAHQFQWQHRRPWRQHGHDCHW
jgi:hypothetical protein